MNKKNQFAIQARNIVKSYNTGPQEVRVLKGLNLDLPLGEVAIIMGRSGVGKSTLLHVLGLLDIPDKGELQIAGQDTSLLKENELARLRNRTIGFVFQFHHLLPEFTALENVMIPAMLYGEISEQEKKYAREILDLVGLSDRLQHKPRELSGGEQQRVAVARALINKPKILMADEPTGNLDKANGEALYSLLLKLNKEMGQTLLLVTHNEHMTLSADRLIQMEDGLILGQSATAEPLTQA